GAIEYLHRWDNVTDPSDVWFLPPFDWNATILCDDVVSADIQPTLRLLVYSGSTIITALEGMSIILAVAIFVILRRDRKSFSKQTYRMNMQMTALLVAQVAEGPYHGLRCRLPALGYETTGMQRRNGSNKIWNRRL
ncbi:hypothetical protein AAVH_29197, partial [Aphelenchoides avenae]